MQYLLAAVRKNSRRIRVEHWLLLAVRTAIIVAVVLAVAEPHAERTGWSLTPAMPTHKVLVLDASYSMALQADGSQRFDRAKQLAEQIVDESSQGDGFTLVLMADPPQVIVGTPFVSPRPSLSMKSPTSSSPRRWRPGVDAGPGRRDSCSRRREIIHGWCRSSSFSPTWDARVGRPTWPRGRSSEFRDRSRRLGETAELTVIDLGQPGARTWRSNNCGSRAACHGGAATVSFAAEVRNYGRQPRTKQSVELLVDGRRAEQTVDVAAGDAYRWRLPILSWRRVIMSWNSSSPPTRSKSTIAATWPCRSKIRFGCCASMVVRRGAALRRRPIFSRLRSRRRRRPTVLARRQDGSRLRKCFA